MITRTLIKLPTNNNNPKMAEDQQVAAQALNQMKEGHTPASKQRSRRSSTKSDTAATVAAAAAKEQKKVTTYTVAAVPFPDDLETSFRVGDKLWLSFGHAAPELVAFVQYQDNGLALVFSGSDSTIHVVPLSELKTAPSVSPDDVSKQVMVCGQAMMRAIEEEILFGESSDDDEAEETDNVSKCAASKNAAPKDIVTKDIATQEDVATGCCNAERCCSNKAFCGNKR
jgi:hypothetical protein